MSNFEFNENDENYILPVLSRGHYHFLGWFDENGNLYTEITANDSFELLTENVELEISYLI